MHNGQIHKIKKEICYYLSKEENDCRTDKEVAEMINKMGFNVPYYMIGRYRQIMKIPGTFNYRSFVNRRYLRNRYGPIQYRVNGIHIALNTMMELHIPKKRREYNQRIQI